VTPVQSAPNEPRLVLDDVTYTAEGSTVQVRRGTIVAQVALSVVGDEAVARAIARAQARLDSGGSWSEALRDASESSEVEHRCAIRSTTEGVIVVDDTAAMTAIEVRSGLRVLAEVARGRGSSFAVLGELESEPQDHLDDHDALGRLAVRLNISQLIIVGHGARHIHVAAGLEGSWDGESVLVETTDQAYDVLREQARLRDVVLVTGSLHTPMGSLVDRLTKDAAS
jgi:UDP-N-acetylmuramoyl-tripeptide--D-alanyl-D-alanine ligase